MVSLLRILFNIGFGLQDKNNKAIDELRTAQAVEFVIIWAYLWFLMCTLQSQKF